MLTIVLDSDPYFMEVQLFT